MIHKLYYIILSVLYIFIIFVSVIDINTKIHTCTNIYQFGLKKKKKNI